MNYLIHTKKLLVALVFSSALNSLCAELIVHVSGADSKPVENAVIYLDHFSREEILSEPKVAIMDQQNKNFVPHIMIVPLGTTVNFSNTDSVNHYVYSFSDAKKFQFKLFKDEKNPHTVLFDKLGLITLGCNIHDFMLGYILVVPNHYYALSDAKGNTQISVPNNSEIVIKIWHERANEDGNNLSQAINVTSSDVQALIKFNKPLKAARQMSRLNEDY